MRKFDTKVQHLKYKVLREVAREAWKGILLSRILPQMMGYKRKYPVFICAIYTSKDVQNKTNCTYV